MRRTRTTNRKLLKTTASFVLASLKASTYSEYASLSLTAALLDGCFEQPPRLRRCTETDRICISRDTNGVSRVTRLKLFEGGMRGFDRIFDVAG